MILDVLVELRSKLEIAEATIQERDSLLTDAHLEFENYKKESRETHSLMQIELENTKNQLERLQLHSGESIGELRKTIIELESTISDAHRDIDSYKQQIENMVKSK